MSEPFFKIRPSKRSNPESRTTLDSIHQHNLTKIKNSGEDIANWQKEYNELITRYRSETDDIERYRLEKEIKKIPRKTAQGKLKELENKDVKDKNKLL